MYFSHLIKTFTEWPSITRRTDLFTKLLWESSFSFGPTDWPFGPPTFYEIATENGLMTRRSVKGNFCERVYEPPPNFASSVMTLNYLAVPRTLNQPSQREFAVPWTLNQPATSQSLLLHHRMPIRPPSCGQPQLGLCRHRFSSQGDFKNLRFRIFFIRLFSKFKF